MITHNFFSFLFKNDIFANLGFSTKNTNGTTNPNETRTRTRVKPETRKNPKFRIDFGTIFLNLKPVKPKPDEPKNPTRVHPTTGWLKGLGPNQ